MDKLKEKAQEAVLKKNYDYAISQYIEALRYAPDDAEAARALRTVERKRANENGTGGMAVVKGFVPLLKAKIAMLTKKYEKAMEDAETFLQLDPGHKGMLRTLGAAAQEAGHLNRAQCAFEDLTTAHPGDVEGWKALAQVHAGRGNPAEAIKCLEKAKRAKPDDRDVDQEIRRLTAQAELDKGWEGAGSEGGFKELLRDETDATAAIKKDQIARTDEEIEAEIARLREVMAKDGESKPNLMKIAELWERKKELGKAKAVYEEVVEKFPPANDALIKIADIDIRAREAKVEAVKKKFAKDKTPENKKAYLQARTNLLKYKIKEWQRRVKEAPTEMGLRFHLGELYMQGKAWDKAIEQFQQTVKEPRRKSRSQNMLGMCFMQKGVFDIAVNQFVQARESLESKGDLWKELTYNIADANEQQGDKDTALAEFKSLMNEDINYKDVQQRVANLG